MMRPLFDRKPVHEAVILAEARGLIEDGLEPLFVLGLYPGEASWLSPLLEAAATIETAWASEQPSYFFEGSLKAKFLTAAREKAVPTAAPVRAHGALRFGAAAATLVAGAAFLGVTLLGFVTSDDADPGDWNYSFKLAGERFRYTTSRGNDRIDLQFKFTETRVQEIEGKLQSGEEVSANDLAKLEQEARELAAAFRQQQLDQAQRERLTELGEKSVTMLNVIRQTSTQLDPQVSSALTTVQTTVAAGLGNTRPLPPPEPSASPSPAP